MQSIKECLVCQSSNFQSYIQTSAQMHPDQSQFNFDCCQDCGHVFLNPRVPPELLKNYYTDFYLPYRGPSAWGKYQKQVENSQQQLDSTRANWLAKYYPVQKQSIVLDIGCGHPTFLQSCWEKYQCQAIGIDFSDEGWKGQEARFEKLQLYTGEVYQLPSDLKADVITMWHYLEHDYEPLANLERLRQHAHPKTVLLIEVPNFDSESRRQFGQYWAGYHSPRHTSLFTPDSMHLLLEKSGWKVRTINTYGTLNPYILYWMSRMEKKGIAWDKNMESEFVNFVLGWMAFYPKLLLQKYRSLGIMTAIAELA